MPIQSKAAVLTASEAPKEYRKTVRKLGVMGALAIAIFASSTAVLAQQPEAERAMSQGEAEAAIAAWSVVLVRDPDNVEALTGRGTARAWQQDWAGAETDIMRALQIAPNHLGALNAAGYLYAWSGRYGLSEQYFERMLAIDPGNAGAKKGLAYTAYWAGENEKAANAFQQIAYEMPEDPEPLIGVGMARLQEGQAQRSASAYRQALEIDPVNTEARSGLRQAYDYPAIAELSVWGGGTSGGGDAGLRLVELASWVTPKTRIWAKYDDGLSLDNPVLARTGQDATTYYLGVQQQFGENVIGIAEVGYRDLPAGENQEIYKLEGVYLSRAGATKLGGQISPHSSGYTDRLVYAGHNLRLGKRFTFEPTFYHSRSGPLRDDEWRVVGYGEYNTGDFAIGLGVGGGEVSSVDPAADGGVFTIYGNASARIAGWHRLHLNVTREEGPLNEFTRVLIGVTLRLPRK